MRLGDRSKEGGIDETVVIITVGVKVGIGKEAHMDGSADGTSVGTTVGEWDGHPVGYSDDGITVGIVDGR